MRQIRADNFYNDLYDFLTNKGYQFFVRYSEDSNTIPDYIALHSDHKNLRDSTAGIFDIKNYNDCSKDVFNEIYDFSNFDIIRDNNMLYLDDYDEFYISYYKNHPEYRSDLNNYYVSPALYLKIPSMLTEKQEAIDYVKNIDFKDVKKMTANIFQEHLFNSINTFIKNNILTTKESNDIIKKIIIKEKDIIQYPENFPIFRDSILKYFNYDTKQIKMLSKHIKNFDRLFNPVKIDYLTSIEKNYANHIVTLDINFLYIDKNIDFLEQPFYSFFTESLTKIFLKNKQYNDNIEKITISHQINGTEFKDSYIGYSDTHILSFEIPKDEIPALKTVIDKWFAYLGNLNLQYHDINDFKQISNHDSFVNSAINEYELNKKYAAKDETKPVKKNKI